MSACDACLKPGHCCRRIALGHPDFCGTREKAQAKLDEQARVHEDRDQAFPFVLTDQVPLGDRKFWRCDCTALGADGRCTVYERRPALCRLYEPGSDDLCVMSRGWTAGDASAGELPLMGWSPPSERAVVDVSEPWPEPLLKAMPKRIQLRRTKGWRMPAGAVKVDRATKWGNPFKAGAENPFVLGAVVADRRHAFCLYRGHAPHVPALVEAARRELAGRDLACWCRELEPGEEDECHGAVLLALANPQSGART